MLIDTFLQQLRRIPEQITFQQTMAVIDANYAFTPTGFYNGELYNPAGKNNGSCKLLAFARLQQLSLLETLHCFGDYYRRDVLLHPESDDHQNIRNFMVSGWDEVNFEKPPLAMR